MQAQPSRNHGESYRGGFHSSDLHEKCDGSHSHGPCAGRETRATQLYTDKIVRCIIRGVKNQMLWNIAYGTKQPKKVNNKMNTYKPRNKACTCLALITDEDEDRMNQYCDQLLLDWICRRGGLKVKLRSQSASRTIYCRSGFPSGWYRRRDGREEECHCLRSQRVHSIEENAASGRRQRSDWSAAQSLFDI